MAPAKSALSADQAPAVVTPASYVEELEIEINIQALDVGALIDLEECSRAGEIATWMFKHTSLTREQIRAVPLTEFKALSEAVGDKLRQAMDPK